MIFAIQKTGVAGDEEVSDGVVCKRRSSAGEAPTVCSHFGQAGYHRERGGVVFFFEMEARKSSKNRLTTTTIKNKSTDCVVFLWLWGGRFDIFTIEVSEG